MIFGDRKRRTLHWAEAFGASAVVHLGAAVLAFDLLPERLAAVEPEPEIEIVSIVLEDDPVVLETPETNAPLVEDPTEGEGEDPPPVVAEDPEAGGAPDEPETPPEEPAAPDEPELTPQTLAPVATETAVAPTDISPLRPEDGAATTLAPVTATALRPVAPTAPSSVTPGATAEVAAAPVISLTPSGATALQPTSALPDLPQATAQAPTPDGATAGGAVSELITRIRGRLTDPCLLAIPQQGADGVPELVMFGSDENAMSSFAEAVLADLDPQPGFTRNLTDSRQCAALNYIRQNRAYPTFRLGMDIDEEVINTGDSLTGQITNTAGRYVSLLMVDDNGVVTDLGDDLSFTPNTARFDVVLSRTGSSRDTKAVLIALATAGRPQALNPQNGQLASDYFTALADEIGVNVPIVMATFDIR